MKLNSILIAALIFITSAPSVFSQVNYLDHQHMDFRIQYDPNAEGTNQLDIVLRYNPLPRSARIIL